MVEQKLDLKAIERGDKTFYNLTLKPNKESKGLEIGNHVVVEKVYAKGYEIEGKFGKVYSCAVNYSGKKCSFLLNEKDHAVYEAIGGEGDKVKITLVEETFLNKKTGVKMLVPKLKFESA